MEGFEWSEETADIILEREGILFNIERKRNVFGVEFELWTFKTNKVTTEKREISAL